MYEQDLGCEMRGGDAVASVTVPAAFVTSRGSCPQPTCPRSGAQARLIPRPFRVHPGDSRVICRAPACVGEPCQARSPGRQPSVGNSSSLA